MRGRGQVIALKINGEKTQSWEAVSQLHCIKDVGIEGDIHAGSASKQVTLFQSEEIESLEKKGICTQKFVANVTISGIDFSTLFKGELIQVGDVVLKIAESYKKCYSDECDFFVVEKDCPMLTACLFATVEKSGYIHTGDYIL